MPRPKPLDLKLDLNLAPKLDPNPHQWDILKAIVSKTPRCSKTKDFSNRRLARKCVNSKASRKASALCATRAFKRSNNNNPRVFSII